MYHYCCPAGETISESYDTEYSTDKIEMHTGAVQPGNKVVLVSPGCCSKLFAVAPVALDVMQHVHAVPLRLYMSYTVLCLGQQRRAL